MTNITSLKEPLTQACAEVFPMFNINYKFMCELPEKTLNSAENINVLVGLTRGLKGNVVLGLPKEAAFKIISGMMGGAEVSELNTMTKSALSEFMNMLFSNALGKLQSGEVIEVSPPTLITGNKMYLMISKAPAKKLFFKVGDTKFNIAYCLE